MLIYNIRDDMMWVNDDMALDSNNLLVEYIANTNKRTN